MNKLLRVPLIFFIFLIALFLRLHHLSDIPVGLHGDEVSIGYNAYSLLKTARDQDGNFLPFSFDQFGNFRAPGYQYLAVPFVAVLDLNSFSVRLPAALIGSLTVVALYFLLIELFRNKQIAHNGALLLAILPWHVNISRATSEAVISSFFVIVGIYFLFKEIKQKELSYRLFFLGFLSLLTSFFFYHASGFFVPVFLPFLFFFSFLMFPPSRKKLYVSILVYIALVMGLVFFLTAGNGGGRVSQVSLLNIPGGTRDLSQGIGEDGIQNPLITRFYHNKLYFYGRNFLTFYSQHLSGDFLFVNNGNPVRYKIPWTGNLYLVQIPFLLLGFALLLSEGLKSKNYIYLIPISWLFIAVIPAALTWEDIPNVLRSNLMIPALVTISAFGFYSLLQLTKGSLRKILVGLTIVFLCQNIFVFTHNYFLHSKIHEPWHRSASEAELVYTLEDLSKVYKEIVMTTERNNNLIFHLFYLKFDPATFHKLGSPREKDKLRFQNKLFKHSSCPIREPEYMQDIDKHKNTLFVVKANECELPPQGKIIKTLHTPDGSPSFHLVVLQEERY